MTFSYWSPNNRARGGERFFCATRTNVCLVLLFKVLVQAMLVLQPLSLMCVRVYVHFGKCSRRRIFVSE